MVQWLRLHAPKAGIPGAIPVQGTRPHSPQLGDPMSQPQPKEHMSHTQQRSKIPHAATKTQGSQINK